MEQETPENYQKVEILIDGQWVRATFHATDWYYLEDGDEAWWMDYFMLEDYTTIPEDTQSGDPLPPWRPIP